MAVDFQYEDNSEEVLREFETKLKAALEAIGLQAEGNAKINVTQRVPRNSDSWYVPTGNLRNSITHTVVENEDSVYIGTNNEYAAYNEFGTGVYADSGGRSTPWWYQDAQGNWHKTSGMKPIHFLRDAIQGHESEYESIADQQMRG